MPPEPIRVVLADDHPIVRGGLVALFETLDGIAVVAQAHDGESAIRETALQRPDVVVMDLRMPGVDGVAATRRITADFPDVAVLVLTMFDEDDLIAEALAAGARGYLLKGADQAEIERALRAVASGDAIFSHAVAERVLRRVSSQPGGTDRVLPQLTARERDIADLMAAGISNGAIADRLSLAPKTVGNHISSIFLKLGVATRAEAIVVGRQAGLGRIDTRIEGPGG
ncbi:response regulator [Microbacterium sp.]|uniref:response regulator n=1 Tax=Microbacterium sp. TaxID=51671 RepID=UPI003C1909C3